MNVSVVYSRRAAAEVEEITSLLAEQSQAAAERFSQALDQPEQQLSRFPSSGAPALRPGTRRLIIGGYIVSYRRRGSDVEIFAIRYARRRDACGPASG
jgi:plasmid stabilization system protein ParE